MREGAVILLRFPETEGERAGKLRPAVVVRRLPGAYPDWLVCMESTRIDQFNPGADEIVGVEDDDCPESGLKATSVVRVCRLAVTHESVAVGSIGSLSPERLGRIRSALVRWISEVSIDS